MIIVSDTTPIHYLILIGAIDILEQLFGQVIIPEAVLAEMQRPKTPPSVAAWIAARPIWLEVRTAKMSFFTAQKKLGAGESEAIALTNELSADAFLTDDRDATKEARRNNLTVYSTLLILDEAADQDLLDLPQALQLLNQTNFRAPAALVQALLAQDAQRKLQKQSGS
jgi:predicted nucleic acid-binding protein